MDEKGMKKNLFIWQHDLNHLPPDPECSALERLTSWIPLTTKYLTYIYLPPVRAPCSFFSIRIISIDLRGAFFGRNRSLHIQIFLLLQNYFAQFFLSLNVAERN